MSPLKRLAVTVHARLKRWQLATQLSRNEDQAGRPLVLYAGKAPVAGQNSSGGAVKLGYLARSFPDQGKKGNILYLVSSALPPAAEEWVAAAKRRGIKVVLNQNGVAYPAWAAPAELGRINGRNARVAASADCIIFQSEFCRAAFHKWVGNHRAESSLIYNPVDTDRFRLPAGSERPFDFLLMGSVAQKERLFLPLTALAAAKERGWNWRARIAGLLHWPEAETELRGKLNELGLAANVQWTGAYSHEEAPAIYGSAKVLVHMQDKDASPTVPLEAMACGTAVIGIASGGLPELVPGELGTLLQVPQAWDRFCYPEAGALLVAMRQAVERPPEAAVLRAWVEDRFSLAKFLDFHAQLFAGLLRR